MPDKEEGQKGFKENTGIDPINPPAALIKSQSFSKPFEEALHAVERILHRKLH